MKKYIVSLILALAFVLSLVGCKNTSSPQEALDDFSFSLTWDCYGISSYDSKTGKLIKTTDAAHPEDYITYYELSAEYKELIYDYIQTLEVESYPDIYNPHGDGISSEPPMTLILTVRIGDSVKTISAEDIAISYKSQDEKGQKFLTTCKAIRDILIETEEWKALPDYEVHYE